MFDFDAGKLLIVGVIALIFIPPKDLPRVLRQVGQFVGKMRRMASEFQGQFMEAMREADMADLRAEAHKLADSARLDLGMDALSDLHIATHKASAPASSASTQAEDGSALATTGLRRDESAHADNVGGGAGSSELSHTQPAVQADKRLVG